MNGFRNLAFAISAGTLGLAGVDVSEAEATTGRSVATTRSTEWSAPVAVSRTSLGFADTALAAEVTGEISVGWSVSGGANGGVWVRRRLQDGSWAKGQLIDRGRDADVGLVADPTGGVCALYFLVDDDQSHLRVACAGSDGLFETPVELGAPGTHFGGYHRLVVDGDGTWTATWIRESDDGTRRVVVARRHAGGGWSLPHAVTPPRNSVRAFDLDTSPGGVVTLAWMGRPAADPDSPYRIRARTLHHEEWSDIEVISGPGGAFPKVSSAGGGRVDIEWIHRGKGFQEIQTRPGTSAGWGDIRTLSPRAEPGFQYVYPPYLARGGQGVTIFAWVLLSPGPFINSTGKAFAVVRTKGRWGSTVLLGPTSGSSERVRLAVDAAGTVIATWLHSNMPDFADDWHVQTRRKPLGHDWHEPGVLTHAVSADVTVSPTLVLDRDERPALVWVGLKSFEVSEYAPRVYVATGK